MTHQAAAGVPALGGWRTVTIALGCALVIGGIGGLIGLGGGEIQSRLSPVTAYLRDALDRDVPLDPSSRIANAPA